MKPHGLSRFDAFVKHVCDKSDDTSATSSIYGSRIQNTFGRLLKKKPITGESKEYGPYNGEYLLDPFRSLVKAMERKTDDDDHDVAAGMTFFGQFIDHDITLDVTSQIGSAADVEDIRNIRTPTLDLDSVYLDGPEASNWMYHPGRKGFLLFGNSKNASDLARNSFGTALIGDPRNDENQILSQLHGAFVCLHNILMSKLEGGEISRSKALSNVRSEALADMSDHMKNFEAARKICRHHYQYLVATEFLEAFVDKDVLESVHDTLKNGDLPQLFKQARYPFAMPIEFSGAAFRFGHATVRADYNINDGNTNFPMFDGSRDEFKLRVDPNKNVEFARLFQYPTGDSPQRAQPIAAKVVAPLYELPFITEDLEIGDVSVTVQEGANNLPFRNLLRDRTALQLPSGRSVAGHVSGAKLVGIPKALSNADIQHIPLWFYCLKEAESYGGRLGHVGGTIVATVLLRLLYLDDQSIYGSGEAFKPWGELVADDGKFTIGHLLKFVDENKSAIENPEELQTTLS